MGEKMRKPYILGAALLALFVFSVVLASTASAVVTFLLAEWLESGAAITSAKLVDQEGELNYINLNGGGLGVKIEILCSYILDGTVGPASEGSITSLLNLAGEEISGVALTGLALLCTNSQNCTEPKVYAEELPWRTELELMEDGTGVFFVDLLLNFKFYFECLVLGVSVSELCTAPTTAIEITNEAGGLVDAVFSDAFQELAGLELGECSGRAKTSELTGLETLLLTSGAPLTASSGA